MRILIEGESRVRFAHPVREHQVQLRIAPWDSDRQRLVSCTLDSEPVSEAASHRDCFGNRVHRLGVVSPHERLVTRLRAEVETRAAEPPDFDPVAPARERSWLDHSLRQAPRLLDFLLHRSQRTPDLPPTLPGEAVTPVFRPGEAILGQVKDALTWMAGTFARDPAAPPGNGLDAFLESRCGGPAELAHFLVALVRGWGVPARYASGYLDPAHLSGVGDGEGQALHAWAEVLIPGAGWCGFDPFLGLTADDTYVGVAVGRDAADVTPERSACKGEAAEPERTLTLRVTRLD